MTEPTIIAFDLAGLLPGKPFAGMAVGEFVDMRGREVTVGRDDLRDFIANTRALIEQYKDRGMPGLPIDAEKHDKGKAAGYIVGVEGEIVDATDSEGEPVPVIRLVPEWTALGQELLAEKIFTNFSPTFDPTKKVIRGGSLTNWPASVDKAGVPLFEAVELAQGVYTLEKVDEREAKQAPATDHSKETDMGDRDERPEQDAPVKDEGRLVDLSEVLEALNAEGADAGDQLAELAQIVERKAELMLKQKLAHMRREQECADLAQQVTGGTPEAPRGIPAEAEAIQAELMKLTPSQAEFWGGLMQTTVRAGLTDYAELGHSRKVEGKQELEPQIGRLLKQHIANGGEINEWFEAAGEIVGAREDYDLSAYEGE